MIKGNLNTVSISGLLQMLANESTRSYRLKLDVNSKNAHLDLVRGELVYAQFGILEGIDAIAELMALNSGEFSVEILDQDSKPKIDESIKCRIEDFGSFHAQCVFLRRLKVGLGTEIVPSDSFGRDEWQEALYIQPLGKFDFSLLGWITDGRTMRQAMAEMSITLPDAIGILYRLVLTGSVEVVRPNLGEDLDKSINFSGIVQQRLEKLAAYKIGKSQGATVVSIKSEKSEKDKELKDSPTSGAPKASDTVQKQEKLSSGSRSDTSDNLVVPDKKSVFGEKDTDTQELPIVGDDIEDDFAESLLESPLEKLVQEEVEKDEIENSPELNVSSINVEPSHFDLKKTDPLPIVSIDIERLLHTSFNLTAKGAEAIDEDLEDAMIDEFLSAIKLGKSLLLVLTDSTMSEASVMATYKYCLENQYIEHHDPVIQLTIDLVLDEVGLVDYLLQRRRITGDQLREFTSISKRQGIEIIKLLVAAGAVLTADLDRLKQEQERFAPK